MSLVHRAVAALGGAALAAALLAGCSGATPETGGGSAGQPAQSGTRSHQSAGHDTTKGTDEGTVTVEIASGPHAGTHTRSGSLKCSSIGDGKWIVFAPGDGADADIAQLSLYWLSAGIDRTVVDTPYPDTSKLLEMKFGSVLARGDGAITISDEVGGIVDTAPPTIDAQTGRVVHHFTATTADGIDMTIAAAPAQCPPY